MYLRKKLFLFLLFPAVVNAAVVDFTIAPQKPWRKIEERTCSVEFSGKGPHPYLWLRPKTLKPDTCYRLSFEAERGALPFAALIREKIGTGWKHRGYADDLQLPAGPRRYSFYFRVAEPAPGTSFALYPLTGDGGSDTIRNIQLEEVTDFRSNLLPEGEFENGTALWPRHRKFADRVAIADSPGFFCGVRSLRMERKAGDMVAVISRDLPALPGKTATIRFWARTERGTIPGILYLDFFRPKYGYRNHLVRKFGFQVEPDWKEFTFRYPIPEEVNRYPALSEKMLRLQFHLPQGDRDAVVWLDNLEYSLE